MRGSRFLHLLAAVALTEAVVLTAASCAIGEGTAAFADDAAQAVVDVNIVASRVSPVPIEGVLMIVEPDTASGRPFAGPRQTFISDGRGSIRAAILAASPAGPSSPQIIRSTAPPSAPTVQACVRFVHDGLFSSPRCGLEIARGVHERIGPVFLSDFRPPEIAGAE